MCILCRVQLKCDGTRWRMGGEVKGKLANGLGSQYSDTTSQHGVSGITTADAHTSAASSRLNWRPRRFKWTHRFAERRNLVTACVPSHFKRRLPLFVRERERERGERERILPSEAYRFSVGWNLQKMNAKPFKGSTKIFQKSYI